MLIDIARSFLVVDQAVPIADRLRRTRRAKQGRLLLGWQDAAMVAGDVGLVIDRELALLSFQVRRTPHQVDELLDPDFREIGAWVVFGHARRCCRTSPGSSPMGRAPSRQLRWRLWLWALSSYCSPTFRTGGDDGLGAARCGGDQPAHGGCFTIRAPRLGTSAVLARFSAGPGLVQILGEPPIHPKWEWAGDGRLAGQDRIGK